MIDFILFWLALPIAGAIYSIGVGILSTGSKFLRLPIKNARYRLRKLRCKHPHVWETGACDAICCNCGKNLGFIQNWRDSQKATK